jgi:hypothetical protein
MILMTMIGGVGTVWGPALGAFILVPASDLILFEFGSSAIHIAILGGLMIGIILFLPRGILPTIGDWLVARAAPRAAHEGAVSMVELQRQQPGSETEPEDEAAPAAKPEIP